jgi:fatty-acyl-CoA synthase
MPIEQIKIWATKNISIRQGYGLTECGPNVFSLSETDSIRKMGSIGFPNFYVDVKVVDEKNQTLAANQVGELWLKGPMTMTGYWKNPKATEDTFEDGWLKTGDLVYFDDENYFYVVGRKKDMYKSGGENVYPAELEQVIQQLTWVKEAAVIGVIDDQWGEVGHAFVSVKADHYDEKELREHCLKNLAKFKNPKFFTKLLELPKGDSGKILKRKLTELI